MIVEDEHMRELDDREVDGRQETICERVRADKGNLKRMYSGRLVGLSALGAELSEMVANPMSLKVGGIGELITTTKSAGETRSRS